MKALGVSPGFALAPAVILRRNDSTDPNRRAGDPAGQKRRLEAALARTRTDLVSLREKTARTLGEAKAEIFEAHLSMAGDPELWAAAEGLLAEGWDAETAFFRACQTFIELLSGLEEEGQRSRADDLKDLRRRLLAHLEGGSAEENRIAGPCILVADDLTPSETIGLDLSLVKGFLTAAGSRTSHASILARSLGLPSATGAGAIIAKVKPGQFVALDGQSGEVILDPDDEQKNRFLAAKTRDEALRVQRRRYAALPTRTLDGSSLDLAANIGRLEDLNAVIENGAEGIGLFRTEFLFLDRDRTPTEDEQAAVYRHVLERMNGRPVVIRTLDIGGDKVLPYLPLPAELNPFLGVRAVRLCFEKPDLFRTQIRALLRASPAGDLRVMVPMVALVEEVRTVRQFFSEEASALIARGVPVGRFQLGIMVEIPSAALNAGALAAEADFFSLGTNDLIQYTMAADRMNDRLAHLYQPLHPSLLRLIDMTVRGAQTRGRWVGVCGEMAAEPEAAVVLLGLGVSELSLSASGIPGLRALISRVDRVRAAETAALALALGTAAEVSTLVRSRHPELADNEGEAT
jgi:phosphotransferase system enzyme I (PtsI)